MVTVSLHPPYKLIDFLAEMQVTLRETISKISPYAEKDKTQTLCGLASTARRTILNTTGFQLWCGRISPCPGCTRKWQPMVVGFLSAASATMMAAWVAWNRLMMSFETGVSL